MSPPRTYTHPQPSDITLPRVLHALSDPIRLEMVRRLSTSEEADSITLADFLPRSTLTYHTRILRESGVTWTRSEGRSCMISLRRADLEACFPGLLDSLIEAADREAAASEGKEGTS